MAQTEKFKDFEFSTIQIFEIFNIYKIITLIFIKLI